MMSNRLSGEEKSFRHYTSTPHLDTFRSGGGGAVSNYMSTKQQPPIYQPGLGHPNYTTSTFSTFSHHKSGADLRYRDDPNPYKVSTIDEFRIQVQDPYKTTSRSTAKFGSYYPPDDDGEIEPLESDLRRLSVKYETPVYHHSSNASGSSSGEVDYEIPDPDYDGSTADSSEDLPISDPVVRVGPPHPGDSCEEYSVSISNSDETASASQSSPSPTDTSTKISDAERNKIEHAFRGRKTTIYVADSLANLYYMRKSSLPPRPNSTGSSGSGQSSNYRESSTSAPDWMLKYTGVPVLLLDTGETKNRDKRQIQILIAELGSGLALWKDVVDNLTSYKVTPESPSFHTMHLSSDHTVVVGLSFDDEETAEKFAARVDKLTSDFANISLSGLKRKNKKKEKKVKPPKYVRPKKTEISQPCGFQHVASLSADDKKLFSSLQSFVYGGGDVKPGKGENLSPKGSPRNSNVDI